MREQLFENVLRDEIDRVKLMMERGGPPIPEAPFPADNFDEKQVKKAIKKAKAKRQVKKGKM